MASQGAPPGQEEIHVTQSAAVRGAEPSPAVEARESGGSRPHLPSADSASSDSISLKSHTSIPVVGTFPFGSLRVHKPTTMDAPKQQRRQRPEPEHDTSESDAMPPLEGEDDDDQQVAAALPRGKGTNTSHTTAANGDIFLLLDLPPNSTVGCDAKAIGTGPSPFPGLRDIPPGSAHFIWVSAPGAMSRCGYWFVTTPLPPGSSSSSSSGGAVRVKQWDAFNEVLVTPPSAFEVRQLQANIAELYLKLVPYAFEDVAGPPGGGAASSSSSSSRLAERGGYGRGGEDDDDDDDDDNAAKLWQRLTGCISEKVLASVCTGKALADADAAGEWLVDTSDGAAGDHAAGLFLSQQQSAKKKTTTQTLVAGGTGELHFLFPEGDVDVHTATATRTIHGPGEEGTPTEPDTSMDMIRLVDTPGTGVAEADLVGQLQFAFLTGLHLTNLACVEQWWHLVLKVVLRAHRLVVLRPRLSRALLDTFRAQMVYNDKYMGGSGSSSSAQQPPADDGGPARHEYGGVGGDATSVLDVVPGNKRRLREALALYKRRLGELLASGDVTPEQAEVGKAFARVEDWAWRLGWDLRAGHVKVKREDEEGEEEDPGAEEDDEYRPVIVDLDSDGREVGLVSFS